MAGDDSGPAAAAANGTARRPRKPKRPEFEFFGPYLGPLGILLGLPAVCYALVYACNASGCMHLAPSFSIPGFPAGQRLFSWQALGVYCAWFAFQVALHLLLPGKRREGVVLPNGSRLRYKLNGGWGLAPLLAAAAADYELGPSCRGLLVAVHCWRVARQRRGLVHLVVPVCCRAALVATIRYPLRLPPHASAGLQSMVISVGLVLYLGFYRRSLDLG